MFQEKRPTCVSVIGWVWTILGGLMLLSSFMALISWNMVGQAASSDPEFQNNMPTIMKFFPHIASVQMIVAIIGLISGINFLRLKAWSRSALEVITWILLLAIISFGGFWQFGWVSSSMGHGPAGFDIIGVVMGVIIFAIYIVPLAIMLKYLRGEKVKGAMKLGTEPLAP